MEINNTFTLSTNIDRNKVFIINRSELEGRIDPHQYHFERRDAIKKIKLNNATIKLKDAIKNVKTITTEIKETDIYIGLENITSNTGEYIPTIDKQSISSAGVFKKDQILFPKLRPYLNKVYLTEFNGLCSTEFHIFESKTFNNKFLSIYLRSDLIVDQTRHLMTGNTLPRLQTEDVNNLPVPNISIDKQNKIVEVYNFATNKKQQKESQAKALLESIDTYILNELGITLPKKDNSLQSRIFTTNFSELTGGRFDSYHHQMSFNAIVEAIFKSKFKVEVLKHLIADLKNGVEIRTYVEEGGIRYLRVTDLGKNGLNSNSPRYVEMQEIPDRIKLNQNCILVSRSGSLGLVNVYEDEIADAILSSHIFKVELETDKINPNYLEAYLRSKIGQSEIFRNNNGGVIPEINQDALKSIHIIIPPIAKQQEIANHIKEIRQQANNLKAEATAVLENAKQEIENMIIG